MAEPQATTPTPEPRSARETASTREPRSFEQPQGEGLRGGGAAAAAGTAVAGEIVRSAADSGRYVAEAGADAGRRVAESWRRSFDPFLAFQLDMNRWLDDLWRQTAGFDPMPALRMMRPFGHLGVLGGALAPFAPPPADLKETKDAHLLSIELPGLGARDIDISLEGDMLQVRGHKIEESEDASSAYRVSERRFGRFERTFPLPPDVDRSRIEARLADGVLKIALPKLPEATPQRAKIEVRA